MASSPPPDSWPDHVVFRLIRLAMDIALIFLLLGAFFFFEWSGLGYVLGFISGCAFFFLYFRWKNGYWA